MRARHLSSNSLMNSLKARCCPALLFAFLPICRSSLFCSSNELAAVPPATTMAITAPMFFVTRDKADDGSRTRDLELGKLALYQLSYVRVGEFLIPKAF